MKIIRPTHIVVVFLVFLSYFFSAKLGLEFDAVSGFATLVWAPTGIALAADLVLLDIMLPGGMNGFDVLEDLKRNQLTSSIPVIVLTNLDSERETALKIGAADYAVKANTSIEETVQKIKQQLK